jgi:peptidoglycan/LPS O-acetylase OafA/YrhL
MHLSKTHQGIFWLYVAGALFCYWTEPRPRLLVAILTAAVLSSIQYISISSNLWIDAARKMGDCAYAIFMSHFAMLMLWSCVYPVIMEWGMPFESWVLVIFVSCNALGWLIWRYIDKPVQRALIH